MRESLRHRYVGQAIGWVSSFFYLGSRVAQIYKTWSRQSAEGLSLAMFTCAITANVLYGVGILIRAYAWEDIVNSAPWLLGSLGTVFLDAIIFSQVFPSIAHYFTRSIFLLPRGLRPKSD